MAAVSKAETVWSGGLTDGRGEVTVASGAFPPFEVTWAARAEHQPGTTSPEELLAAAHAACFSMALSNGLAKAGHPPEQLNVSAEVTFQPGEGVKSSVLAVRGRIPGIDEAGFRAAAEDAKANCPVSKALAGTEISLAEARLEG